MKKFLLLLLTCALLHSARPLHADQNPAPVNVGLSNYSTFTVSTSTASNILPKNSYRAGFIVQNQGAVSVVLKFGSVPANATDGIVLTTGSYIQFSPVPVDALYGQSASSTAKIVMMEFSK